MEQFYIKWRWCSRYYNSVKGLKKGINQLTIVTPIHDQYWSGKLIEMVREDAIRQRGGFRGGNSGRGGGGRGGGRDVKGVKSKK
ncbi:4621_t:CDS:2 [Entrophospora sp. SA101]|nr:4621_t:CDS:2 [Entrophospora sp. SA101]